MSEPRPHDAACGIDTEPMGRMRDHATFVRELIDARPGDAFGSLDELSADVLVLIAYVEELEARLERA